MICPDCRGRCRFTVLIRFRDGSAACRDLPCSRCAASGEVADRPPGWQDVGAQHRSRRASRAARASGAARRGSASNWVAWSIWSTAAPTSGRCSMLEPMPIGLTDPVKGG
jgi:hypothetical protein